jgi:Periplasmic protein TonB, links inner and outer membranes
MRRISLVLLILSLPLTVAVAQVRLSPEASDKLLIDKTDPVYPPLAKATRVEGTVKVDLTVSETGRVVAGKVIAGHPLLKAAAVAAATQRIYKPHMLEGKPVPFVTLVDIVFVLGMPQPDNTRAIEISQRFFEKEGQCRDLLRGGKLQEAEAICGAAVQIGEQLDMSRSLEKMSAHELMGHLYMRQQRHRDGLKSYLIALTFARLTLEDKNAEVGQLYSYVAMAHHALDHLDQAREFYRKAEASLQLAYVAMACDHCDEAVDQIRQDYMRSLKRILDLHLVAAQQAGASSEVEELNQLKQSLPK